MPKPQLLFALVIMTLAGTPFVAVAQNTVTNEVTEQEATQMSTSATMFDEITEPVAAKPSPAPDSAKEMPDYLTPDEIGTYDKRENDAVKQQQASTRTDDHVRASNAVLGILADDVALTIDGEARVGFIFGENFDLDSNAGFTTLNYISSRAALKPTLYISEISQLVLNMNLLPNVLWGGEAQWAPEFTEGYLQFVTLAGRFRIGRQLRGFGLGLAWAEGYDNEVPFGFVDFGPSEDRIDWAVDAKAGGIPIRVNTSMGWIEEPLATGQFSFSDRLRYTVGAGTSAGDKFDVDVLAMYEWQRSNSLSRWDVSIATRTSISQYVEWQLEAGMRRGTTAEFTVYDHLLRSASQPELKIRGYRAATRLSMTDSVRTRKGITFEGTQLRAFFSTGPKVGNPYAGGEIRQSGTSNVACGCLIAGRFSYDQLLLSRQQRITAGIPDANAKLSVANANSQLGQVDGLWSAAFVGKLGFKGLTVGLGYFFLRAPEDTETRILRTDSGTTSATFDDQYIRARTLGHELDLTARYLFHEHIEFGVDAGLLIGDELFQVDPSNSGPAYMILPRLTVSF